MKPPEKFSRFLRAPKLTRTRIVLAFLIAIAADGLQWLFNVAGWFGPDQVIDIVAMLLETWLLGFHWLLLPSFILELVPLADEFPTWTACVIAVTVLRRREQRKSTPLPREQPVIDV